MAALPYMQFHIAEYLADTSHLTTEEHGAYLLLIFNYWQRGKALDNTNGRLSNVVRTSNERWSVISETLSEYFDIVDNVWTHRRIEADLQAVNDKCEKARNSRKQRGSTNVERTLNERSTKRVLKEEKRVQEVLKTKAPAKAVELPDWVDPEAWEGYSEMRNKIRKPMTDRAASSVLKKLSQFLARGHDPNEILATSMRSTWTDVYEPKGNGNGHFAGKTESSLNAAQQAVAIIAQREANGYYGPAGETGRSETGQVSAGRLLDSGGRFAEIEPRRH